MTTLAMIICGGLGLLLLAIGRPLTGALSLGIGVGVTIGWKLHQAAFGGTDTGVTLSLEQQEVFNRLSSEARSAFTVITILTVGTLAIISYAEGKFKSK